MRPNPGRAVKTERVRLLGHLIRCRRDAGVQISSRESIDASSRRSLSLECMHARLALCNALRLLYLFLFVPEHVCAA